MAETWRCSVQSAALTRLSDSRRVLQVVVIVAIIEQGPPEAMLAEFRLMLNYPARAFRGLTLEQARQLVRVEGVEPIPPLNDLAAAILQDWQDGASIRQIPAGWEFGPR